MVEVTLGGGSECGRWKKLHHGEVEVTWGGESYIMGCRGYIVQKNTIDYYNFF